MSIKVLAAEHLHDMVLKIKFNDQKEYIIDLGVFILNEPLKIIRALQDQKLFHDFTIAHGTICWANGADLAPEYLYFLANKEGPQLHEKFTAWGYL